MENEMKPEIRFKEFTDAWEQDINFLSNRDGGHAESISQSDFKKSSISSVWKKVKLGEITTSYSGGTPIVNNKEYYGGEIPFIRSGEISHNKTELFLSEKGLMNSSAAMVQKGDILYALYGATSGEVAISQIKGAINQAILAIKANDNFLNFFIALWLSKEKSKILDTYLQGGQGNLSAQIVKALEIVIPEISEQEKIGRLFSQLDSLVTLHQRKCEKLKNVKKSLLEKMFPAEGKDVPEIRFKEFTDAWEQRKLGESCKSFTDGDWIESKDQSESGVRLLQTGNVGITNFIEKDNKKWITEETFNRLHCSEVCPGDILISRLPEPAGRACIVPDIGYKMITAVDCTIVKNDENFSNEFLVQFLSTAKYFNTVNDFLAGGTRQRISRSSLSKFDVLIPEINEKTKIGAFFSKLDNLITLHQRKCEKLKNIKKALLEKMFC